MMGSKPGVSGAAAAASDDDDVYPVHMFDDSRFYRSVVMSYVFRFNDVLDAQMLRYSLSRLLEIGDWRKLGGRVREMNGQLHIHALEEYTVDQPAISFTHEIIQGSIESHPLASQLGKSANGPEPSSHKACPDFRSLTGWPNTPGTVEQIIKQDAPQISLRVTSFFDATLVTLAWPHTLMDAVGLCSLLRNWALVLNGKENTVSKIAGAREDILQHVDQLVDSSRDRWLLEPKIPGVWGTAVMVKRIMWNKARASTFEERTFTLSDKQIHRLHKLALAEAADNYASAGKDAPFLSKADVVLAWLSRFVSSSNPTPEPLNIMVSVNLRFRLTKLLQNFPGDYIQNMVQIAYIALPPQRATAALGPTAVSFRTQLTEQTTEKQIASYVILQRERTKAGRQPAYFAGDMYSTPVVFNNLARLDIFRAIDFGTAVLRAGTKDDARKNPPGTPTYFHRMILNDNRAAADTICVLGRDYYGKHWVTASLRPRTWVALLEDLEEL